MSRLADASPSLAPLLTPKRDVVWVSASGTVGQALERMRPNGFSAVPILDDSGRYVGTLCTSDLLWFLLGRTRLGLEDAQATPLLAVLRRLDVATLPTGATLSELVARSLSQSFVPIVSDRGSFVGIVRRRRVIEHLAKLK